MNNDLSSAISGLNGDFFLAISNLNDDLFFVISDLNDDLFFAISYQNGDLFFVILDINECLTGKDDCDENATCTNTHGSYLCACNRKFTGDGVNCTSKCCNWKV